MRRKRVGMWTLGITLVLMGAGLLYREMTGIAVDIGRYWPLAVIGLGVELLIAQSRTDLSAGGSVRVSGLALIGLIIVLALAPAAQGPWGISCSPVGTSCNGGMAANQESRLDRGVLDIDWSGVTSLEVDVKFGTIDIQPVSGGDAPSARLTVVGHGYTTNSAKSIAQSAELRTERSGDRLVLRGYNQTAGNGSEHADLDLTIRVPAQTTISVNDEFGPASVEGMESSVKVVTRFSTASVSGVTGEVAVESEHGRIDVSRVTGPVTAKTTYGQVTVTDVSGRTDIKARHGAVEVRDIQSSLTVEAEYGRVSVTDAAGDVNIDSKHGTVDLRYPGGAVSVDASYGGINVRYGVAVAARCDLKNTYGGIAVEYPKDSGLELDVVSQRTRITTNMQGVEVTPVGSGSTLKVWYNGGGPAMNVRNDFGRVELRVF